jgi:CRP/FNR family nitrogen fixation transcriptional regulator
VLVNINTYRRPVDGHLAALTGERVLCSEYKYRKGTEIFGEGEEAEYVYQITAGAVRTHKQLADGRRQINAFHLPGDMFGFENGSSHRFTAEAIIETNVRIMRRGSIIEATEIRIGGTKRLLSMVTQNLQHAEDHLLLLGRKTAPERVATFLVEMDARLGHPQLMTLPMSRRDIADYLGLTLETVSRALSRLRDQKLLRFEGTTQRRIQLLRREELAELGP